jgi:hypothetical protein
VYIVEKENCPYHQPSPLPMIYRHYVPALSHKIDLKTERGNKSRISSSAQMRKQPCHGYGKHYNYCLAETNWNESRQATSSGSFSPKGVGQLGHQMGQSSFSRADTEDADLAQLRARALSRQRESARIRAAMLAQRWGSSWARLVAALFRLPGSRCWGSGSYHVLQKSIWAFRLVAHNDNSKVRERNSTG